MFNRREFSTTLALATAAGLVRPGAAFGRGQRATVFDWQPINDSMRAAFGAGGNVLAVTDGGSLMLVDAKNPGFGGALRAEAESFGGTLEMVINTHHHGDHSGSNPFFTSAGIPVYGQVNGVERALRSGSRTLAGLLRDPEGRLARLQRQLENMDLDGAALATGSASVEAFVAMGEEEMTAMMFHATETFEDELDLEVGDTEIELRHIGRGHTDNDLFVYLPDANVMHAGDLFFNGLHPYIDVGAGATTVGWQEFLDEMIDVANGDTVVVPGHGPLSDRDGLRIFFNYFDILREFVHTRIDDGMGRAEIVELVPPSFDDWPRTRLDSNLGIVYDELTGR